MSFGDLTRINTNLQAMSSLNALQRTNAETGLRQLRLATGSRINRAEDDSAGYTIAKKLEARVRGQAKALDNIGDGDHQAPDPATNRNGFPGTGEFSSAIDPQSVRLIV